MRTPWRGSASGLLARRRPSECRVDSLGGPAVPATLAEINMPVRSRPDNLRLRGVVSTRPPKVAELIGTDAPRRAVTSRRRDVYFERDRSTSAPVVDAADLGSPVLGLFIIERWDTSVSVPPGWQAARTVEGHICLELMPQ